MGSIQEDILTEFLRQLAELPEFDTERVKALQALFGAEKKPKADSLVEALSSEPQDKIP